MADSSKIEWTDATWNPVTGCTKVSPGCDHCYAETLHERFNGKGSFATVTLHPDRLDLPLRWKKPRRVFVNSMSDLFHKDVSDEFIAMVFAAMALTPRHTFQILTKRHARMRSLLSDSWFFEGLLPHAVDQLSTGDYEFRYPLPNVWLGVSTEDQKWADIRIPALLETPAAVRWISAEPLLGPVDLDMLSFFTPADRAGFPGSFNSLTGEWSPAAGDPDLECRNTIGDLPRIDWVVVGGESGPGARPMHPEWARSLRDQCAAASVPFLFKQWGAWAPESVCATEAGAANARYIELDGGTRPAAFGARGDAVTVQRNGKGRTGRRLDGRTWDEYPAGVA